MSRGHQKCYIQGAVKVLNLTTFCYTFGHKNVIGLSNGFILCSIKISCFLLVYCARYNILKKASWTMTDFNKIRYHAVTKILDTAEHSATADTQPNDCCLPWRCAIIYHSQHSAIEFHWYRRSLEANSWSGHLSEIVCEENCRAVENIVQQNRRDNVQLIRRSWANIVDD